MNNNQSNHAVRGVSYGIGASLLFGSNTPIAKVFLNHVTPWMLTGLFVSAAGVGLSVFYLLSKCWQKQPSPSNNLKGKDWFWLAAATLIGGVTAPVLLMVGVNNSSASSAALLLSLEGVFTTLIAWFIFRERFDWWIAWGISAIFAGSIVLSSGQYSNMGISWGSLAVIGACLCWATDNNLIRQISHRDALQIVTVKTFVAGGINLGLALAVGESLPKFPILLASSAVGVLNYGVSVVLLVLALRHIGASRTGAYFSLTPFVGAAISVLVLGEGMTADLLFAGVLIAVGVWLCLPDQAKHH